jgi:hypothetical protein
MDQWNDTLKYLAILSTTKELLSISKEDGLSGECPKETTEIIKNIISYILNKKDFKPTIRMEVIFLFEPTGSCQEIAMQNGWQNAYKLLAKEYDKLTSFVKQINKEVLAIPYDY